MLLVRPGIPSTRLSVAPLCGSSAFVEDNERGYRGRDQQGTASYAIEGETDAVPHGSDYQPQGDDPRLHVSAEQQGKHHANTRSNHP